MVADDTSPSGQVLARVDVDLRLDPNDVSLVSAN
jgi:hypothetical protein